MNWRHWRLPSFGLAAWIIAGLAVFCYLALLYLSMPSSQSSEDLTPILAFVVAATAVTIWLIGLAFFAAVWAVTRPSGRIVPVPFTGATPLQAESAPGRLLRPRYIHGRAAQAARVTAAVSGLCLGDVLRSPNLYPLALPIAGIALSFLLLRLPDLWLMPWMVVLRREEDDRRSRSPSTAGSSRAADANRELAAALAAGRNARDLPRPDVRGIRLGWRGRLDVWRWAVYPLDVLVGVTAVTFIVMRALSGS